MGSAIELNAFIAGSLSVSLCKAFIKEGIAFLSPILPRASAAGYAVHISSLSSISISASTTEDSLTLPKCSIAVARTFSSSSFNASSISGRDLLSSYSPRTSMINFRTSLFGVLNASIKKVVAFLLSRMSASIAEFLAPALSSR